MHKRTLAAAALAAFAAVALGAAAAPADYQVQLIAEQWSTPVGAAAGPRGELYVAEAGISSGTTPRVVRLDPGNKRTTIADDFPAVLTGITLHDGKLYVSYVGGVDVLDPATGIHHPIISKLPAHGDHPNTAVTFGPDGKIYFGVGTATNSGVVGDDNIRAGWVKTHPELRDIPCKDVTVRGSNFTISNPLTPDEHDKTTTGAFSAFGKTTARLQVIKGALPCTGAVLRTNPDGTGMELVAWGLRNPASLAFGPDGQLYAAMQGYEDRGSRPIVGDVDYLYRIEKDRWYGWPDFAGGRSVTEETFHKASFPISPLLAQVPEQPPAPIATFPPAGGGIAGLLFPPAGFGLRGDAVATLGDHLAIVNPRTGNVAPMSLPESLQWLPRSLAPGPNGTIYVLDMGGTRPGTDGGQEYVPGSGRIWRLSPGTAPTTTGLSGHASSVQWQWALVGLVLWISGVQLYARSSEPG